MIRIHSFDLVSPVRLSKIHRMKLTHQLPLVKLGRAPKNIYEYKKEVNFEMTFAQGQVEVIK